jgi:hypothetical protein
VSLTFQLIDNHQGYNKQTKRLEIATSPNQDPVVMQGLVPLLGIDVWEHGTRHRATHSKTFHFPSY